MTEEDQGFLQEEAAAVLTVSEESFEEEISVEESGSGVEESGSGVEESGSGVEESGSSVEESGSGVEESGSSVEESGSGVEETDLEGPYIQLSDVERSFVQGSYVEEESYAEESDIDGSFVQGPYAEESDIEGSYVEEPYVEGSFLQRSYIEESYVEESYIQESYVQESYVHDAYVQRSYTEESVVGEFVVEEVTVAEESEPETSLSSSSSSSSSSLSGKREEKKMWYWLHCCLISGVILVVVTLPVLLLVIFPKIAQASLNGSDIQFTTINISEPANTSFIIHTVGNVNYTGSFEAEIHYPDPISVYWQFNDSSLLMGNMTMEDMSVKNGKGSIDSNSVFTVANVTTFTNFNSYLLSAPDFSWRLIGVADVSVLGRTLKGLTLNKTIKCSGMNGFPGIKILNITLPMNNTSSEGIEIDLIVEMNNQSPLGIQLGDVKMRLDYEGTTVGPAFISDIFLSAGVNHIPIKTVLLSQSSANGSAHVSDLLSKFIKNIPVYTLSYGLSAYPNGHDPIVWLTPAIQNLVLNVSFVAPDPTMLNSTAKSFAQSSIRGASLSFKAIKITNETDVDFTTSLDVFLNNTGPLSASIQFPEPIKIFSNGVLLGSVIMPSVNVANGSGHLINQGSTFTIADTASFGDFTKTLLASDSLQLTLIGNVSATALNRTFTGLTLTKTVTLKGMDGFKTIKTKKVNLPHNAQGGGISMSIVSILNNPSPISVQLGLVSFLISYKGVAIGSLASSPNFILVPGINTLNLNGKMIVQNVPIALNTVSQLLTLYVAGTTVQTTVQGKSALPDGTNTVAWLDAGIKSLSLSVSLNNSVGVKVQT